MFSFGQSSLSVLGQAFESLGQIVAPIEEEEERGRTANDPEGEEENEQEDEDDFESHIRNFIDQRRNELSESETLVAAETPSPTTSLVDVALDDDSVDRQYTSELVSSPIVTNNKAYSILLPEVRGTSSTNDSSISSFDDFERRLQQQYREKLELELRAFNQRYQQLQYQSDHTTQLLQEECERWKQKAADLQQIITSTPTNSSSSVLVDDQAAIIDVLNGKCTCLQNELQSLQEERSSLVENNNKLTIILHEHRNVMENHQATVLNQQQTIESLESEKKILANELLEIKQILADTKTDNQRLTSRLEEADTLNQSLKEKLQQLSLQLETKEAVAVTNNLELTALRKKEKKTIELTEKLSSIESESKKLQLLNESQIKEIREKEQQVHHLESQLEEAKSDIRKKTDVMAQLDAVVASLRSDLFAANQQITTNESELSNLMQRLQLTENERQRFREAFESKSENDQTNLQHELLNLQSQCETFEMEKCNLESELQRLKQSLMNMENVNRELDAALLQSENTLKETEEIAWKSKAEAAEYLSAFELEENESSKLRAQLGELQTTHQSHMTRIHSLYHNMHNLLLSLLSPTDEQFVSFVEEFIRLSSQDLSTDSVVKGFHYVRNEFKQLSEKVHDTDQLRNTLSTVLQIQSPTNESLVEAVRSLLEHRKEFQAVIDRLQSNSTQLQKLIEEKDNKIKSLEDSVIATNKTYAEAISDGEKQKSELQREKLQREGSINNLQEQLKDAKSTILRMETDNKNLQVVIAQLRNAGRAKSGEAESVQNELQHLRVMNNQLIKDLEEHQRLLKRFDNYDAIVQERERLHVQCQQFESYISEMKLHQALIEKDLYAKSTSNDILQSELKMMKQDLTQRMEEVNNLQDAIEQIQADHKHELSHYKNLINEAQKLAQVQQEIKELKQRDELENQLKDLDLENKKLREQCEDQVLLRRQIELSFHQEKRKMQQSLEQLMAQMKNSTHDVIDRTLISNLIVSYFQRRRSLEVLQLIAKVLCFNDEQLVIVGLKVPPLNILSSIFSTVLGPPEPVPVEGDNLAEMWVNYLINQAEDDSKAKAQRKSAPPSLQTQESRPEAKDK